MTSPVHSPNMRATRHDTARTEPLAFTRKNRQFCYRISSRPEPNKNLLVVFIRPEREHAELIRFARNSILPIMLIFSPSC